MAEFNGKVFCVYTFKLLHELTFSVRTRINARQFVIVGEVCACVCDDAMLLHNFYTPRLKTLVESRIAKCCKIIWIPTQMQFWEETLILLRYVSGVGSGI